MISLSQLEHIASITHPFTSIDERLLLSKLAQNVPDDGMIVEIGTLYGGATAVLALSNPKADITTIDNYSWHPEGYQPTSPQLTKDNLASLNIKNVKVDEGDSRRIGKRWKTTIDLLWIDGGHSYQYVYSDLLFFGYHAWTIALHDYDNPKWPSIRQAVDVFIKNGNLWYIDEVVDMIVVLRRK